MINQLDKMTSSQRNVGVYSLLLLATIVLTGYELTIIDFKFDAPRGVELGNNTRDAGFMVTKGKDSLSTGIYFPPYFAYYMGALTTFSQNPQILSIITAIFSTLGLAIAMFYFRANLPESYALYAAALLAVNPAFVIMSHILWELSPQLFFMPFLLISIHRFIQYKNRTSFIFATIIVTILSQFYLTGFFFYPLIALLGLIYWRNLRWSGFAMSLAAVVILSAPYIYFLVFQGGLSHSISSAMTPNFLAGPHHLALLYSVSMASIHELFLFFNNFDEALYAVAGNFGKPLYWSGAFVSISFVIGWLAYIVFIFSRRRLFSVEPADTRLFPLPFQIAGFLVTGFIGLFIAARSPAWYQHSLILYPCYPLLAAWPFWRLFSFWPIKIIAGLTVVSTICLLYLLMSFSKPSYGWFNQSLSYRGLEKLNEEIWQKTPEGYKPQIFLGPGGVYSQAVKMSWAVGHQTEGKKFYPVTVRVMKVKAPGLDRYQWAVNSVNDRMARRAMALDLMGRLIPDGALVSACDKWNELGRRYQINGPFPSLDTSYGRLKKRKNVSRFPHDVATAEYIALDIGDPRILDYPLLAKVDHDAKKYLFDKSFGLVFAKEGILLFRKGAAKEINHLAYLSGLNRFYASVSPLQTGENVPDYLGRTGSVRVAEPEKSKTVAMSIGPYITLPKGSYVVRFRLKTDNKKAGEVVMIDVASDMGKKIYISRSLSGKDFTKPGEWNEFSLSFDITDGSADSVEFRAFYLGGATVSLQYVVLEPDYETFLSMVNQGGVK